MADLKRPIAAQCTMGCRLSPSTVQRAYRYRIRLAKITFVALAAGVIGTLIGLGLLASARYTHAFTHPGCGETGLTSADVGIEGAQEVTYPSHDGLTLRAWYLPPQLSRSLARKRESGVVIILLPGLGGSREGMLQEGAILARHGYGLLMTDLRSCAHPKGETTLGYREAADLVEAVSWVNTRPGVTHVGVLGYSLGGVTAILGAAQDERIGAIVAEGGFYDLAADISNAGGDDSLWERLIYRAILFFFHRKMGIDAHEISPIAVIDQISPRPLLLIYGEREVESARAREQLAQAREPKELWIVPECGHGGYLNAAPEEWERRVVDFFDENLTRIDDIRTQ